MNLPLQVQKHGPADVAGVENNDVLVEVNGVNVMNEPYDNVVARIKESGDKITLLVCSKDAYKYFQDENIRITDSMADPVHDTSEPPAYTETSAAESERTSPEPRERVSIAVLNKCQEITEEMVKELPVTAVYNRARIFNFYKSVRVISREAVI